MTFRLLIIRRHKNLQECRSGNFTLASWWQFVLFVIRWWTPRSQDAGGPTEHGSNGWHFTVAPTHLCGIWPLGLLHKCVVGPTEQTTRLKLNLWSLKSVTRTNWMSFQVFFTKHLTGHNFGCWKKTREAAKGKTAAATCRQKPQNIKFHSVAKWKIVKTKKKGEILRVCLLKSYILYCLTWKKLQECNFMMLKNSFPFL